MPNLLNVHIAEKDFELPVTENLIFILLIQLYRKRKQLKDFVREPRRPSTLLLTGYLAKLRRLRTILSFALL